MRDGYSGPLLTEADALDWTQRYLKRLERLDRQMDYGDYAIKQIKYSFTCADLPQAKTPAVPAKNANSAASEAASPRRASGTITVTSSSDGSSSRTNSTSSTSADFSAALKAAERRDSLVAAERKRFGPGKDKEIRQLVDLRERIAGRKPRVCKSNAFKEVINFEHLQGVLLVTRDSADKIYADMKRRSATSCPQSSPASLGPLNCSGEGKYLTCTVTKECRAVEYPCPSNRQ